MIAIQTRVWLLPSDQLPKNPRHRAKQLFDQLYIEQKVSHEISYHNGGVFYINPFGYWINKQNLVDLLEFTKNDYPVNQYLLSLVTQGRQPKDVDKKLNMNGNIIWFHPPAFKKSSLPIIFSTVTLKQWVQAR